MVVDGVSYTVGDGHLVDNGDSTWSLTIPAGNALTDGSFDVTVTVTDAAGNSTGESTSGELTIDTTAPNDPTEPLDLASASDSGNSNSDDETNLTSVTLSVPAGSASAGDTVTLLQDGSATITTSVLADGSFTLVFGGSGGRQSVIELHAERCERATSAAQSPDLTVTLDTIDPVPAINTPDRGG